MHKTWLRSGAFAAAVVLGTVTASAQAASSQGHGSTAGQAQSGAASTAAGEGPSQASASGQQVSSADRKFVQQMLLANMAEIQLGQLGTERATNPEVKSFAEMMVRDHSQANQELMPLAQQLGVQAPTELDAKHRNLAARLSSMQGEKFDREFMKAMVSAHRDVVKQSTPIARRAGVSTDVAASSSTGAAAGADTTAASTGSSSAGHAGHSGATTGTSGTAGTSGSGESATAAATTGSTDAVGTSGATGDASTAGASAGGASAGTSGHHAQGAHGAGAHAVHGAQAGSAGAQMHGAASTAGAPQTAAQYAAKTLPVVQQHLEQAQRLEQTLGR